MVADIAKSDGEVTSTEIDVIQQVAAALGLAANRWVRLESELGLVPCDHWRVLGLAPGAGRDEIKAAYRRYVLQSHPDKVAPDQRAAATAKTIQLRRAYETLMAQCA